MDISLKQRLIGAVVLIGLGVIFIPMLLDGSGRSARVTLDVAIPPEPVFKSRDALPPLPPAEPVQETPEETAVPLPPPPPPRATEARATAVPQTAALEPSPPAPKPEAATAQEAWVVQVGAFGEEPKALALRDRLRKAGFPAFVEPMRVEGKTVHRVRVGPELERAAAEKLQARLAKEERLDGIVYSHP